jgi:dimethylhistidine N-methyltransferase
MTATTIVNELASPAASIQEFAQDVFLGLDAKPKYLKPKYFYDYTGSQLFEEICYQPEYYLTRTEAAILEEYSPQIARMLTQGSNGSSAMIELGSGSSLKTRILLQPFLQTKRKSLYYLPIDISHSILQNTVERLSREFPRLKVIGLVTNYFDGIQKANELISNENISAQMTIVFLGSSVGNFELKEAESFLNVLADRLSKEDSLLIGFDLHKNEKILNAAYNDFAGITAKFNLNILARINRELGGEFDPCLFKHHGFYNKEKRRIEMHLVSTCKQQVHIKEIDKTFDFEEGESIHTENSYKHTIRQIDALAKTSNLKVRKHFTDRNRWFDVALFERVV